MPLSKMHLWYLRFCPSAVRIQTQIRNGFVTDGFKLLDPVDPSRGDAPFPGNAPSQGAVFFHGMPNPRRPHTFPSPSVIAPQCPASLLFPAQLLISSKLLGSTGILTLSRCPHKMHPPLSPRLVPEERYQQLLTANTAWEIHIQTRKV